MTKKANAIKMAVSLFADVEKRLNDYDDKHRAAMTKAVKAALREWMNVYELESGEHGADRLDLLAASHLFNDLIFHVIEKADERDRAGRPQP